MQRGTLYVIASPIGNLEDISMRAIRTLAETADFVYCEDTRQTKKLLAHYQISKPVRSLHAHSGGRIIDAAVELLAGGASIAYLTDSGTPGISDPGAKLVAAARAAGVEISPLPGPSAVSTIVSVSGFPEKNILFAGFLSKKEGRRKRELLQLKEQRGIIVLFESPHRIKKLLGALLEVFPDSPVIVGREMSKLHEEFLHGSVRELCARADSIIEKGEFTIALYNRTGRDITAGEGDE